MKHRRTALLLGAGVSVAAGQPSTKKITDEILSDGGLNNTLCNYSLMDPTDPIKRVTFRTRPFDRNILVLLQRLFCYAEKCNTTLYNTFPSQTRKKKHAVNFEDIYYMLCEIHNYLSGNFSPIGCVFHNITNVSSITKSWKPNTEDASSELDFIEDAFRYMSHSFKRMLNNGNCDITRLKIIIDLCKSPIGNITDIFTLNHDTIIEDLLNDAKLSYIDGFGEKNGDLRKWKPTLFDQCATPSWCPYQSRGTLRLLKLHGSLDWRIFFNTTTNKQLVAIYIGLHEIEYGFGTQIIDENKIQYEELHGPQFLIGSTNKLSEYLHVQYWDMFERFRKYLRENDNLIVAGYSFGDDAINGQILEWLMNEDNKRLIVIDVKNKHDFSRTLPVVFTYKQRHKKLMEDNKFFYLGKDKDRVGGIEYITLQDLEPHLKR